MNFLFGNAAMLPALALAGIPVLVHLFARARPRAMPFSSIRFLNEVIRRSARIQHPKSWLILLLRTLLFLALALALTQPIWMPNTPLAGPGQQKSVVVIVDTSASMAVIDGARTRLANAAARASEILEGLGANDRANVIWIRESPAAEFPSPGINRNALVTALRRAQTTAEAGDARAALEMAANQLADEPGGKEIFVISDFQATNWSGVTLPTIPGADWVTIQVGDEPPGNQAITRILPSTRRGLVGEDLEILVEVANYSAEPVQRSVFLRTDDFADNREVRIEPWQSGTANFVLRTDSPGERAIEATLDEDAFPLDNRRWTVVETAPSLRVALGGLDSETSAAWKRVVETLDWVDLSVIDSDSGIDQFDVVMIAGWDGSNFEGVDEFVAQGGGLVVMPDAGLDAALLAGLVGPENDDSPPVRLEQLGEAISLRVAARDPEIFEIFERGSFGDPAGGRVAERFVVDLDGWAGTKRLLEFQDGVTALAEASGPGRVFFWLIPAEGNESWMRRPETVPLIGEILNAARPQPGDVSDQELVAGQSAVRSFPVDLLEEEVGLVQGEVSLPITWEGGDPSTFTSATPLSPGVYSWLVQDVPEAVVAVNFPREESDLRSIAELPGADDVRRLSAADAVAVLRAGTPLWPWLVAAALFLVIAESAAVWRFKPKL